MLLQKDSWAIDYQATKNVLETAREKGAQHFVLLSAICVQKPLLEFQHAKLKLEAALQSAGDITYSIVRPTAFFKSLAGQVRCCAAPRLCRTACCLQPDNVSYVVAERFFPHSCPCCEIDALLF